MAGDYGSTRVTKAPRGSMKRNDSAGGFRSTYSHQAPSGNPLYGSESDDDESNLSSSPRSPLLANKRASISQSSDRPRRPSLPAHMHQSYSHSQNERYDAYRWLSNTGSEPGIDVRQDPGRYAELDDEVGVTVVDYATDGTASRVDLPGSKLETWLNSQDGKRPVSPAPQTPGLDEKKANDRPRKSVRWINLDGINFETIKVLALKYNLHPLAIEDALRANNNPRSKIDFYAEHLYTQVYPQYIRAEDEEEIKEAVNLPAKRPFELGSHATYGRGRSQNMEEEDLEASGIKHKQSWAGRLFSRAKRANKIHVLPEGVEGVFEPLQNQGIGHGPMAMMGPAHRSTVDELSAKYMVPIRRTVYSCFMLRDGTLITMSATPYAGILDPIYLRLENPDGILRKTSDSSMLLEALLDIVVDIAIEISQAFEAEILKIEAGCLIRPEMGAVRHLHVISSQLTRLKRTLSPLSRVLYTLRNRDQERALASLLYGAKSSGTIHQLNHDHGHHSGVGHMTEKTGLDTPGGEVRESLWSAEDSAGYISRITKIYLSDVIDHLDTVLNAIDQFTVTTDHLTSFVFNLMSFDSNSSMERLSLVTVIFMPATFMTGYWGMNIEIERFTSMPYDDYGFWLVAIPVLSFFFIVFCHQWIWNTINVGRRLWAQRKREEAVYMSRKHQ
ncbi:hypothetical protein FFLO_00542 [Filobasidium floriforme]|uniref:Magnesium transport protein CorA n=1 Tax=Filobasidium floriforme TaxID=5210 RepID=A0A8K0NTH7_9TREE|nr:hypothetical protein FFLO_00542 [Filobasidium floriforme]